MGSKPPPPTKYLETTWDNETRTAAPSSWVWVGFCVFWGFFLGSLVLSLLGALFAVGVLGWSLR